MKAADLRIALVPGRRTYGTLIVSPSAWCHPIASWAQHGLNFIIYSADILAARDKLSQEVNGLRVLLGDAKQTNQGADTI